MSTLLIETGVICKVPLNCIFSGICSFVSAEIPSLFPGNLKKGKVGQVSVRIFRDFARVATPRFFGMKVLSYFRDPNLYFGFSKHFAAEIQKEKAFLEFGNQIFF